MVSKDEPPRAIMLLHGTFELKVSKETHRGERKISKTMCESPIAIYLNVKLMF